MVLGGEAIVSPEAQRYIGIVPACISLLQDGTRELVWGIIPNNPQLEKYHTIRWFSSIEVEQIEKSLKIGDMKAIQDFLNRYI